jgi:hypothetical protein
MADDLTAPESLTAAPAQQQQPARPSLLGILFSAESGGQNIANTTQGTSSGQAQGFFQITTGTWGEFAPRAGVDTTQFPTPMSAPYPIQARVASTIPLARWDPKTISAIHAYYPNINTSATLGQNVAMSGGDFAANAPGNQHDSQFKIAAPATGSGSYGGGLDSSPYALAPRPPRNFLDQVGDAVTQTAEQRAAPQAAQAPAKPAGAPIAPPAAGPLGLQAGQMQQPTPQPVPKTTDYYLALLKHRAVPEQASG